ncbi:MAG: hypothetical protein U9R58_08135 [Chloroflexota bacterium]|nr:hypothetical protein [Chloroflexota bacterium]
MKTHFFKYRTAAGILLILLMVLIISWLAACGNIAVPAGASPSPGETESLTLGTNTESPTSTATELPTATPTPAPPPKAEPGQPDIDVYPVSIAELNLDPSQRIDELEMLAEFQAYSVEQRDALKKELTIVTELLRQALVRQDRTPEFYDLITDVYQTPSGNFSWKVYVRFRLTRSILWPRDNQTGLPVIDGSVYQYLKNMNSDNLGFTLEPFTPPEGFSSGQIVHTRSIDGWPVAGLVDEEKNLGSLKCGNSSICLCGGIFPKAFLCGCMLSSAENKSMEMRI